MCGLLGLDGPLVPLGISEKQMWAFSLESTCSECCFVTGDKISQCAGDTWGLLPYRSLCLSDLGKKEHLSVWLCTDHSTCFPAQEWPWCLPGVFHLCPLVRLVPLPSPTPKSPLEKLPFFTVAVFMAPFPGQVTQAT